jgi:hypothetical protein
MTLGKDMGRRRINDGRAEVVVNTENITSNFQTRHTFYLHEV